MKRLIVVGALLLSGCQSPPDTLTESMLEEAAVPDRPDRFLGNLRDALADHFEDCGRGLSFTTRALSRATAEDWARFTRSFD